jgi:hypothetical protein
MTRTIRATGSAGLYSLDRTTVLSSVANSTVSVALLNESHARGHVRTPSARPCFNAETADFRQAEHLSLARCTHCRTFTASASCKLRHMGTGMRIVSLNRGAMARPGHGGAWNGAFKLPHWHASTRARSSACGAHCPVSHAQHAHTGGSARCFGEYHSHRPEANCI